MAKSKRIIEPLSETFSEAVSKVIRNKDQKETSFHPKEQDRSPVREITTGKESDMSVKTQETSEHIENEEISEDKFPPSPFAKFRGQIELGGDPVDCYVLDTGERVISLRSTLKAMANVDTGKLGDYIGVTALNPFINKENILGELRDFHIPGTQLRGKGITSDQFELICRAYVQALYEGAPLTDRQKEIAVKCAVITAGLTRTGLDALIDEATGYQYEREEDELQVKLRAFIADELRAWEKTFPDDLWEEFGRLTNWQGPLHSRPKYWGKLVIELIYDTLDPDVAIYLRENRPLPSIRWHQQLTENYGVRQLVSRCYEIIGLSKSCDTIEELRLKVGHHYGKQAMLFKIFDKPTPPTID